MLMYLLHAAIFANARKDGPLVGQLNNPDFNVLDQAKQDLGELSPADDNSVAVEMDDKTGAVIEESEGQCQAQCKGANFFVTNQSWVNLCMKGWFFVSLFSLFSLTFSDDKGLPMIFGLLAAYAYGYVTIVVNQALCIGKKAKGSSVAEKSSGWMTKGFFGTLIAFAVVTVHTAVNSGLLPAVFEMQNDVQVYSTVYKSLLAAGVVGQGVALVGMFNLYQNMKASDEFPAEKMYK